VSGAMLLLPHIINVVMITAEGQLFALLETSPDR